MGDDLRDVLQQYLSHERPLLRSLEKSALQKHKLDSIFANTGETLKNLQQQANALLAEVNYAFSLTRIPTTRIILLNTID